MFPLAELATVPTVLLIIIGGVLVLKVGTKLLCLVGRLLPLTLLGAAAIIGGVMLFHTGSDDEAAYVDHPDVETPDIDGDDISVHLGLLPWKHLDAVDWSEYRPQHLSSAPPRWVIVTLGTLLIISGALLAGRGKTRPVAVKAFTVLGIGAILFAVVSFFGSAPRLVPSHARIVRVEAREAAKQAAHETAERAREVAKDVREAISDARDAAADKRRDRWAPHSAEHGTKAKRPSRAKRPVGRDAQRSDREIAIEDMPPRAGEIPVTAELKNTAVAALPAAETASPAAAAAPSDPPAATPVPASAAPPADAPPTPDAPPAKEEPAAEVKTETPGAAAPAAAPPATPAVPSAPAPGVSPPPSPAVTTVTAAAQPAASAPSAGLDIATVERPAWVESHARLVNSVYSLPVASGPFATVPECQRELDRRIKFESDRYIDDYMGDHASQVVKIPLEYLKQHVKKAEYNELIVSESVGPMQQIHALLEFDDAARADFHRLRHDAIVTGRLWYAGSGAALVLALLATFYGYLKLDLRSGGTHKGRLQLAATLVALIVAAGALLLRRAVPF